MSKPPTRVDSRSRLAWAGLLLCSISPAARGGMPSITLTDLARLRLESISFFLLIFFVSALGVQGLWNFLRRDFTRLPRLTYGKSLAIIGVWGMLFVLVLTMISGARELMTPGAWEKDGVTYRLAMPTPSAAPQGLAAKAPPGTIGGIEPARWDRLTLLKACLWAHAKNQGGKLPESPAAAPDIPPAAWQTPEISRAPYLYLPGRKTGEPNRLVACEPDIFHGDRLALFADGDIRAMKSDELASALKKEGNRE